MGGLGRRAAEEVEGGVGELASLSLQVCRPPLHLAHDPNLVWQPAGLGCDGHGTGEVTLGGEDLSFRQVFGHHVLLVPLLDEELNVPGQLCTAGAAGGDGPVVEFQLRRTARTNLKPENLVAAAMATDSYVVDGAECLPGGGVDYRQFILGDGPEEALIRL